MIKTAALALGLTSALVALHATAVAFAAQKPAASPSPSPTPIAASTPLDAAATPTATPALPTVSPTPINFSKAVRGTPRVDMALACPGARGAAKLESDARDAHAVASYEQERALLKQEALVFFRCASSLANRRDLNGEYAHDRAMLAYADALMRSFPANPEPAALSQLTQTVNDLLGSTTFAEIQNGVVALNARLPAALPPATPTPGPEAIDGAACRASGFSDTLTEWFKAYSDYASAVNGVNSSGRLRATPLNQLLYTINVGSESGRVKNLSALDAKLESELDAIHASHAAETETLARTISDHVHEVSAYADSFTSTKHVGAASVSDRDHLQQSRLAVDETAKKLRALPYCQR